MDSDAFRKSNCNASSELVFLLTDRTNAADARTCASRFLRFQRLVSFDGGVFERLAATNQRSRAKS
jgi:hypothetical protein